MENTMNSNEQQYNFDPKMLIEELSIYEYYVGVSNNISNPANASWRIKKISKVGSVWYFQFPEGNQEHKWTWNDRVSYTYS